MTIKCPNFGNSGPSNNSMGSDISLKENINLVGKSNSGINIYEFNYKDKKFGSWLTILKLMFPLRSSNYSTMSIYGK